MRPDDPSSARATPASERIDADDEAQVERWARRLDTTPLQVRDAIAAVGDRADEVEMRLKGTRSTTNADQEARGEQRPDDRPR